MLLYGKGGGAWVGASNPAITVNGVPASFTNTSTSTNFGWTAGAGIEWAFSYGWSARAEWDYIRLQNQNFTVASTAPGALCERRDQRQQSQHQYVHRRLELQVRRLVVISRTDGGTYAPLQQSGCNKTRQ